MKEVEIAGQVFRIRSLKRGEVKKLRQEGYSLLNLTPENAEEAQEKVFEILFTKDQLEAMDQLDYPDSLKIWQAILDETYNIDEPTK